jgi:hypothetical protein
MNVIRPSSPRRALANAFALGLVCVLLLAGHARARDYDPQDEVDHGAFDELLTEYVQGNGVRYEAWSESGRDRQRLTDYLARLAASTPSKLTNDQQLAFWINAYNAVTLDLVLENYPIDSIKDTGSLLSSPWKKKRITIEGNELSLDAIENEIIRKQFSEPRIHFALNCAAVSCPPLRAGAYDGRKIDAQLEEQTAAFLGDRAHNFVDEKGRLHLSKILDWYKKDFERKGTLVDFVRPYVPELGDREKVDVEYEGYDWALNEAS